MSALRSVRAAFSYFSILPVGVAGPPDGAMMAWLPLVGAVVGALSGGAAYLVSLAAPHALAVATAFGASIVLTGAIHLDGFLDGCDAFFASATPERRREILDDPGHGTFALAGFAVAGAVWISALWSMPPQRYVLTLATAAAAARLAAVAYARVVPYGDGAGPSVPMLVLSAALVGACATFAGLARGAAALACGVAAAVACMTWIRPRLGGRLTGDAYGFTIVVAEVAMLAAFAA